MPAAVPGPKCRGCKRRLKRASPSGYGPVCARRLGLDTATPRVPAIPTAMAPIPPMPGQDELPLTDQQPLWSL